MDTIITTMSHASFKDTTLPCLAGWRDVSPLFMIAAIYAFLLEKSILLIYICVEMRRKGNVL